MCEQCLAECEDHGSVVPGIFLVRATRDGHSMRAGQWGLVVQNDPFVVFDEDPWPDPVHGLSDDEIDAIEDDGPMVRWLEAGRRFEASMVMPPEDGHVLLLACEGAGYSPQDGSVSFWLFHRMGEMLRGPGGGSSA